MNFNPFFSGAFTACDKLLVCGKPSSLMATSPDLFSRTGQMGKGTPNESRCVALTQISINVFSARCGTKRFASDPNTAALSMKTILQPLPPLRRQAPRSQQHPVSLPIVDGFRNPGLEHTTRINGSLDLSPQLEPFRNQGPLEILCQPL